MLFNFRKTRQPQAGAEAYAFTAAFQNPEFTLFRGAGTQVFGNPQPLQPAQAYYPFGLTTTTGFGGLIYGTLYNQPLYVPQTPQGTIR